MIMAKTSQFSPQQIVCLEQDSRCLYCEVIQVIESRQLCWVRPLFLTVFSENTPVYHQLSNPKILIDVRSTSDLLYPITLFRPALDTEVFPLFTHLEEPTISPNAIKVAKQQLHQFITQVWQANPEKFQRK